jgi:hypothetical protein
MHVAGEGERKLRAIAESMAMQVLGGLLRVFSPPSAAEFAAYGKSCSAELDAGALLIVGAARENLRRPVGPALAL